MTPNRHGSAVVEFPNDLEIVITREFDAPIALVFDVFTKPEHVRKTFAPSTSKRSKCGRINRSMSRLKESLKRTVYVSAVVVSPMNSKPR